MIDVILHFLGLCGDGHSHFNLIDIFSINYDFNFFQACKNVFIRVIKIIS
jgi:hypothetical protein